MKCSVAIVGLQAEISPFSALGLVSFPVTSVEECRETLFLIKKKQRDGGAEFGIVFVTEQFLRDISREDYEKLSAGALPAIIPLPSESGNTGFGNEKIRRIVEKAVGSDIFGNEK